MNITAPTASQIKYCIAEARKANTIIIIGDSVINVANSFGEIKLNAKGIYVKPQMPRDELLLSCIIEKTDTLEAAEALYKLATEEVDTNNPYAVQRMIVRHLSKPKRIEKLIAELEIAYNRLGKIKELDQNNEKEILDKLTQEDLIIINMSEYSEEIVPISKAKTLFFTKRATQEKQLKEMGFTCVMAQDQMIDETAKVYSNMMLTPLGLPLISHTDKIERFPVYTDEPITKRSNITIAKLNNETLQYYRDLFQHHLNATSSVTLCAGLFIDGRIAQILGYDFEEEGYANGIAFQRIGVGVVSPRYKRLQRLFIMCSLSSDMQNFLNENINKGFVTIRAYRTTVLTSLNVGRSVRGLLTKVKSEQMKDGTYKIVYEGTFIKDTFKTCLKKWVNEYEGSQENNGSKDN